MDFNPLSLGVPLVLLALFVISGFRIVKEYERGVVLRLGSYTGIKGPGVVFIIPLVDRMFLIDMRVMTRDVPPQDVITRDNVSMKVNAVIYFRVLQPDRAILQVEDYLYATSQYAQTTLRSILGQAELDEVLSERERINHKLQEVLDRHTDPWGVKVTSVELKYVDLPQEMQRAMARQAEAERERRAKIIAADGELQSSGRLSEAATTLSSAPGAMTLRYLQTLAEIAIENNSTTIFPVPIDLLQGLQGLASAHAQPSTKVGSTTVPPSVRAVGDGGAASDGGARAPASEAGDVR